MTMIQVEPAATDKKLFRTGRTEIVNRFSHVRSVTEHLTEPLETEDFVIQVVEFTSPAKWHLAHTSWFFETLFLEKALKNYESLHPQYNYLFNSYYLQAGDPHCRSRRGNLSRPTVREVFDYRESVNRLVIQFLEHAPEEELKKWWPVIEIGLNHEQQHQELLLTDLKYMFAQNPLRPLYQEKPTSVSADPVDESWISFEEGLKKIGHSGDGFGYDNEFPRHKTWVPAFELCNRLVTNGEFLAFMNDGGYENPRLWLDEGFEDVTERDLKSPLYWFRQEGEWLEYTLHGIRELDLHAPVSHINYYEADAYAEWAGCRLPTEQEWEVASEMSNSTGAFSNDGMFHPTGFDPDQPDLQQMLGNLWEWTQSSYSPYPGYAPLPGVLGEYNGKFMSGKYVLKGGSCATPRDHIRNTYRNFFTPDARWQFSGIRLAR